MIVASEGVVIVHLTQFRLPWARPSAVDHALVKTSVSLVLVVQRGISLLGQRVGLGRSRLLRKAVF